MQNSLEVLHKCSSTHQVTYPWPLSAAVNDEKCIKWLVWEYLTIVWLSQHKEVDINTNIVQNHRCGWVYSARISLRNQENFLQDCDDFLLAKERNKRVHMEFSASSFLTITKDRCHPLHPAAYRSRKKPPPQTHPQHIHPPSDHHITVMTFLPVFLW